MKDLLLLFLFDDLSLKLRLLYRRNRNDGGNLLGVDRLDAAVMAVDRLVNLELAVVVVLDGDRVVVPLMALGVMLKSSHLLLAFVIFEVIGDGCGWEGTFFEVGPSNLEFFGDLAATAAAADRGSNDLRRCDTDLNLIIAEERGSRVPTILHVEVLNLVVILCRIPLVERVTGDLLLGSGGLSGSLDPLL